MIKPSFDGSMDDVRSYKNALSATDVTDSYSKDHQRSRFVDISITISHIFQNDIADLGTDTHFVDIAHDVLEATLSASENR
jgi:hypothetical protein